MATATSAENGTGVAVAPAAVDVDSGGDDASGAAADAASGDASGWNGELTALQTEEWFSTLPEEVRAPLLAGLQAKHTAWERGYRPRMEANAKRETELQTWQDRLTADEKRWWRITQGTEDPATEWKTKLEAAEVEMRRLETELAEAKAAKVGGDGSSAEVAAARAELAAARAEVERLNAAAASAVSTAYQEASAEAGSDLYDWLASEHPAIVASGNEGAFDYYGKLIAAEMDAEEAVSLTYVKFPKLQPMAPASVEPAVARMAVAGAAASGVEGGVADYWERIAEMRRAAKD